MAISQKQLEEKLWATSFLILRICTKFMRSTISIFISKWNFGSHLKIDHFEKMDIWHIEYHDQRISDENLGYGAWKAILTHKKIKTTGTF